MLCRSGHFGKSCSWCEITRNYTSIKCGCAKLNGDWVDAEIDICKSLQHTPRLPLSRQLRASSRFNILYHEVQCLPSTRLRGLTDTCLVADLLYNWFGYLSCFNIYEYFWDHAFDCRPGWHPGPNDNDTTCSHGGCSWTDHQAIGPLDIGAGAAGVPRNATDRLEEYLRRGGKQA